MGKIQLYPHRWKDKGNTVTASLGLCRILSSRTVQGMLTQLGLESHVKEESQQFESWCYLGVRQMFHKVKINVIVSLPMKINTKKSVFLRKNIFSLSLKFSSSLFCCFPPQLWLPQQPVDYWPRHSFLQVMPVLPVMEKAEYERCFVQFDLLTVRFVFWQRASDDGFLTKHQA